MAFTKAYDTKTRGKIWGYGRVSTKGQDVKPQRLALRQFSCDEIITDKGISGKRFNRKGLNKILNKMKAGDKFVVQRLDRLGRSVYHLARLRRLFRDTGVEFVSIMQPMDLSTANGKMLYGMLSVIAEHESDLNGERTKGTLTMKRKDGVSLGRPPTLSDGDLVKAYAMLRNEECHYTKSDIAGEFNVSVRTLSRGLKKLEAKLS